MFEYSPYLGICILCQAPSPKSAIILGFCYDIVLLKRVLVLIPSLSHIKHDKSKEANLSHVRAQRSASGYIEKIFDDCVFEASMLQSLKGCYFGEGRMVLDFVDGDHG
jgi:hypothetical protein